MSAFSAIDFAELPAPTIIVKPDYEQMLARMKAEAIASAPELAPFLALESEPMTKLLEVCAEHRMLDHIEFNDRAKGLLLATAWGSNLDHHGVPWGIKRLIVQEADDSVSPPIPQIMESDDNLRRRIQLAPEALTTAGSRGSYTFWALSVSGQIKDVNVYRPDPELGKVNVCVLSHVGDGAADQALLDLVSEAVSGEYRRPLDDTVTVQTAVIIPYQVEAELTLYDGPGAGTVLAQAEAAVAEYISRHHRIDHDITHAGLIAALCVEGVQNVNLVSPAADIVIDRTQAAYCTAPPVIRIGGVDV